MRSHLRKTLPLAAGLVAIGALSGGGLVWAHGNATEISACVEPRTGYLVYGRSCGGANITWSQQGPAGPAGQAGPAGPQGAPGPKGAAGKGIEASPAEIQLRNHPPKGLRAAPGKPDLGAPREAQAQPRRRRSVGLCVLQRSGRPFDLAQDGVRPQGNRTP